MTTDAEQQTRYKNQRLAMVDMQIDRRGIDSPEVLNAMRQVPREFFLSPAMREFAYEDTPLPISKQQTISQPYIVAYMVDALLLTGGGKVLEVGTGSGYAAAILGEIADRVISLERHKSLADSARHTLGKLSYDNVEVIHTDGSVGWPEGAPYDGIVVAAGGPKVPQPLKDQLAIGGRLVIPVGASETEQSLMRITRVSEDEYQEENLSQVRFVPLVGEGGWRDNDAKKTSPDSEPAKAKSLPERKLRPSVRNPDSTPETSAAAPEATTSELIARGAEPIPLGFNKKL